MTSIVKYQVVDEEILTHPKGNDSSYDADEETLTHTKK